MKMSAVGNRGRGRLLSAAALGCLLLLAAQPSSAGVQQILDAIESSEFKFARTTSEVPFMPLAWVQDQYYPNTQFETDQGALPSAMVMQNTFSVGAVLPAYVGTRDILLVGGDFAWDRIDVKSGPYNDQSVLRLTPVFGWARQVNDENLVGAFVAPVFSKQLTGNQPWGSSGYAGIIGMYWLSDDLQLLYGGVYENSFGRHAGYPYLGLMWQPNPHCTLSLVFPWPTFTYAPAKRWIVQMGIAPGGSMWVHRGDTFEVVESLGSWNLNAGTGYRLRGKWWLYGGVGMAGFRGVDIESGDSRVRFDSKPSFVFTLALQFRP